MNAHRSENLDKIRNIVVLMLENHSFDNMLGWLYENEAPPDGQSFDGLHSGIWNPLNNRDSNGVPFVEKVYVHKNGTPRYFHGRRIEQSVDYTLPNPDPGEGFIDTNQQLFQHDEVARYYPPEPTNMGFVNNYLVANLYGTYSFNDPAADPRSIMITYTPEQLPVLSTLAKSYAVCDRWFCSVPSQTLPNRDFIHAATSTGNVNNRPHAVCDATTIYNKIEDAIDAGRKDLSWGIYGNNPMMSADRHGAESDPDYFSLTRLILSKLHDPRFTKNFHTLDRFFTDCEGGTLPRYCFLEPNFCGRDQNDQHPPADVRAGEQLIADIYNHLVDSPRWRETLLVITYDEHGGCFDHVAPPQATPPDPAQPPGQLGFIFNRLGPRVPSVLVSPYIRAGTVCRPEGHIPFDHTSVLATARRLFGLDAPLTERDKHAPDLGIALNLDSPRSDKVTLKPLPYEPARRNYHDLHEVIADTVGKLTGRQRQESEDPMEFATKNFGKLFRD